MDICESFKHYMKPFFSAQVLRIGTRVEEATLCCARVVARMKTNTDACRQLQKLQMLRSCLNLLKQKRR